jgi:hypothetical protein
MSSKQKIKHYVNTPAADGTHIFVFFRYHGLHLLLAVVFLLFFSPFTYAANYYWNVSSGDWSDPANWCGIEPTSSDNAYIQNDGTATITQSGEECLRIFLGAEDSGTVEMTAGSLTVSYDSYVGYTGTGTFTQTGGINKISSSNWSLYLGYIPGSSGTYNLNGGALILKYLKGSGTAEFNFGG